MLAQENHYGAGQPTCRLFRPPARSRPAAGAAFAQAPYKPNAAADGAKAAADAADDPDAEREWQRLRLAAYVLGEVEAGRRE